jgi:hypothetical protein
MFNPSSESHGMRRFLPPQRERREFLAGVESFYRQTTRKGDRAIVVTFEVLHGEHEGCEITKLYAYEGAAAGYFAELCRAAGVAEAFDPSDDLEVSRRIGRCPVAITVGRGREFRNGGGFFNDVKGVRAAKPAAVDRLREGGYTPAEGSLAVEPPEPSQRGMRDDGYDREPYGEEIPF